MKKILGMLVAAACAAVLWTGCGSKKPVLHVYTWADYVMPELVERFEREQGCRVVIDTYDSNEAMYAKLKAGATGYDLLFPTSYMVQLMHGQGMLQKLDHAKLPNIKMVDADHLKLSPDAAMDHSVPYMLTTTGIGYLASKVENFEPSWAMFDRADLAGRMTMLDDIRETLGGALKLLGYSINSTNEEELKAARDVVVRWKKNLAKFENEQYKTGLASGEFLLVHGYNGDITQVMEENEDIAFGVPKEGTVISCDDMVIPKGAPNPELAHAFINFLHDPAVAAENTDYIGYLAPNTAAYPLMSEEIREDPAVFLPPEVRARCELIADLGEAQALWTRIWDEIKAAE